MMHSLVWRTLRLKPLRPVTRRALRRHNRRKPRSRISWSFGSEEMRRQFEDLRKNKVPTSLDNGRRSPRKLQRAVVAQLLGQKP